MARWLAAWWVPRCTSCSVSFERGVTVHDTSLAHPLNRGYCFRNIIPASDAGSTIVDFYCAHYGRFPREEWLRRIAAGLVRYAGAPARADQRIAAGAVLEYHREPWEEAEIPSNITVLYEDEHLAVFDKPDGMQVLPAGGFLENTMVALLRKRYDERLSPMHRLGRGTTGAILFARTTGAARLLSAALRERRVGKDYLALARGTDMSDAFSIDLPIGRVPHPLLGSVWNVCDGGKPSRTEVTVLARDAVKQISLLQVRIPTGRTHQIRIHLAAAGHPLEGDRFYGASPADEEEGTALPGDAGYKLHSWKLRFPHPATGADMEIIADPPEVYRPYLERFPTP